MKIKFFNPVTNPPWISSDPKSFPYHRNVDANYSNILNFLFNDDVTESSPVEHVFSNPQCREPIELVGLQGLENLCRSIPEAPFNIPILTEVASSDIEMTENNSALQKHEQRGDNQARICPTWQNDASNTSLETKAKAGPMQNQISQNFPNCGLSFDGSPSALRQNAIIVDRLHNTPDVGMSVEISDICGENAKNFSATKEAPYKWAKPKFSLTPSRLDKHRLIDLERPIELCPENNEEASKTLQGKDAARRKQSPAPNNVGKKRKQGLPAKSVSRETVAKTVSKKRCVTANINWLRECKSAAINKYLKQDNENFIDKDVQIFGVPNLSISGPINTIPKPLLQNSQAQKGEPLFYQPGDGLLGFQQQKLMRDATIYLKRKGVEIIPLSNALEYGAVVNPGILPLRKRFKPNILKNPASSLPKQRQKTPKLNKENVVCTKTVDDKSANCSYQLPSEAGRYSNVEVRRVQVSSTPLNEIQRIASFQRGTDSFRTQSNLESQKSGAGILDNTNQVQTRTASNEANSDQKEQATPRDASGDKLKPASEETELLGSPSTSFVCHNKDCSCQAQKGELYIVEDLSEEIQIVTAQNEENFKRKEHPPSRINEASGNSLEPASEDINLWGNFNINSMGDIEIITPEHSSVPLEFITPKMLRVAAPSTPGTDGSGRTGSIGGTDLLTSLHVPPINPGVSANVNYDLEGFEFASPLSTPKQLPAGASVNEDLNVFGDMELATLPPQYTLGSKIEVGNQDFVRLDPEARWDKLEDASVYDFRDAESPSVSFREFKTRRTSQDKVGVVLKKKKTGYESCLL